MQNDSAEKLIGKEHDSVPAGIGVSEGSSYQKAQHRRKNQHSLNRSSNVSKESKKHQTQESEKRDISQNIHRISPVQMLVEARLWQDRRLNQGRSTTYPSRESETRTSSPIFNRPRHAVQQFMEAVTSSPLSILTLTVVTGRAIPGSPASSSRTMTPRLPLIKRKISAAANISTRKTIVACSMSITSRYDDEVANPRVPRKLKSKSIAEICLSPLICGPIPVFFHFRCQPHKSCLLDRQFPSDS